MPLFPARRRYVNIETVGVLYAVPIAINSNGGNAFNLVAMFHPEDNRSGSSILSRHAALALGVREGHRLTIAVRNRSDLRQHDLEITVGQIVDNYPDFFIWVSTSELETEFSFSDRHPSFNDREIQLIALDPLKCYPMGNVAAVAGGAP